MLGVQGRKNPNSGKVDKTPSVRVRYSLGMRRIATADCRGADNRLIVNQAVWLPYRLLRLDVSQPNLNLQA